MPDTNVLMIHFISRLEVKSYYLLPQSTALSMTVALMEEYGIVHSAILDWLPHRREAALWILHRAMIITLSLKTQS